LNAIALTKIWLYSLVSDRVIFVNKFSSYRTDRPSFTGGINNNFSTDLFSIANDVGIEFVAVKASVGSDFIFLTCSTPGSTYLFLTNICHDIIEGITDMSPAQINFLKNNRNKLVDLMFVSYAAFSIFHHEDPYHKTLSILSIYLILQITCSVPRYLVRIHS